LYKKYVLSAILSEKKRCSFARIIHKIEEIMDITKEAEVLYTEISQLIDNSKQRLAIAVNIELPMLYWHIGSHTKTFILQGERAAYGQKIIISLSKRLILRYGKGWSSQHLRHCLRSAETIELDTFKDNFV
jgi:DUF1016 N-terminal domain